MNDQVLSIKQIQELIELGIDTSKASAVWIAIVGKDCNPIDWLLILRNDFTLIEILREKFPCTYKEGNIYYTFTLQDILEMLPEIINYDRSKRLRVLSPNKIEYNNAKLEEYFKYTDTLINASFEMLKWCKQNNYI